MYNVCCVLCDSVQVVNESVTSVGGGVVSSAQFEEVVVCTYSGRVLGLSREPQSRQSLSQEVIHTAPPTCTPTALYMCTTHTHHMYMYMYIHDVSPVHIHVHSS